VGPAFLKNETTVAALLTWATLSLALASPWFWLVRGPAELEFSSPTPHPGAAGLRSEDRHAMVRAHHPTSKDDPMMKQSTFAAAFALSLLVAGAAQAQPVMRDGVLADATGRTLYTFDKDAPGKSNCTGGCLAAWPAFTAKPEAQAKGEFGLIDGTRQWTVNGKPLYYYVGDAKPGDRTGDGQGGVWHAVTAKPVAAAQPNPKVGANPVY